MVSNLMLHPTSFRCSSPIDSNRVRPEHQDAAVYLVLLERCPDVMHLELFVIGDAAMPGACLQGKSIDDVFFLLLVQKLRSLGTVRQDLPYHE
jgi:hypothetical protein